MILPTFTRSIVLQPPPAQKLLNGLTDSNFIGSIQARFNLIIYVFKSSRKSIEPFGDVLLDQCTNGWGSV